MHFRHLVRLFAHIQLLPVLESGEETTLIGGQVSKPFSMQIIFDQTPVDDGLGEAIRQLSRRKYGKARAAVEKDILDSLRSSVDMKSSA